MARVTKSVLPMLKKKEGNNVDATIMAIVTIAVMPKAVTTISVAPAYANICNDAEIISPRGTTKKLYPIKLTTGLREP